ncbi:MAG: glycosyltransferase family 2 protein [Lentisphaerae bacterium]|nr:glycosyltransferase family 2 protein [Lentisphaerota bacterium]
MRDKISACLTAGNEERNIRRCLESLRWVDEIVVVDSYSRDRTVEISREYTDRVYQHEWLGYVGQKELIKKMATHNWVLFIDADEEVSDDLREEILREFHTGANRSCVGYKFPRKVFFMGQWITYGEWWPDLKLRLFRKDKGISTGTEPHDYVAVQGPVRRLQCCLHHYTYDDISDQIATLNRFSTISSSGMHDQGRRVGVSDLVLRPLFRFFKAYFLKRGFAGGQRGLIISVLNSVGVFLKYAKLWELNNVSAPSTAQPPDAAKGA